MNTVEQAKPEVIDYDDDEIAEYLRKHPEFFERNSELLADLQLPHSAGSGAVSLIERQVSVLRNRNEEVETRLREFVHVAHSNDELADKIHGLALILMGAGAPQDVIEIVEAQLRTSFGADRAVLTLFNSESTSSDSSF